MSEVSRERLVRAFEGLVDAMVLLKVLVFFGILVNEVVYTLSSSMSRILMIEKGSRCQAHSIELYLTLMHIIHLTIQLHPIYDHF